MAKEEQKLKQTKSSFKLRGVVTRINQDGAYKEELMTKGAMEGKTYRKLSFGVKTSENNEIFVSMFDFEPDYVYLWNKQMKEDDPEYKGTKVAYGDWEESADSYRDQGFTCLQTKVGLEKDEKGKLIAHGMVGYDAQEYIFDHLTNGDSVVVEGELRFTEFPNREGVMQQKTEFSLKKIFKVKEEIDLEAEDHEEVSIFEQEMVYVDSIPDKEKGELHLIGRMIDYKGRFIDSSFIVKYKDEEGNNDPEMVSFVSNVKKLIGFGDLINVYGQASNRLVVNEVQENDTEEEDVFAKFGGKKKSEHAKKFVGRKTLSEMLVEGIDKHEKGLYEEDDFIVDELTNESDSSSDSDDDDPFASKSKAKSKSKSKSKRKEVDEDDPFADNAGKIEISDDDLPF